MRAERPEQLYATGPSNPKEAGAVLAVATAGGSSSSSEASLVRGADRRRWIGLPRVQPRRVPRFLAPPVAPPPHCSTSSTRPPPALRTHRSGVPHDGQDAPSGRFLTARLGWRLVRADVMEGPLRCWRRLLRPPDPSSSALSLRDKYQLGPRTARAGWFLSLHHLLTLSVSLSSCLPVPPLRFF